MLSLNVACTGGSSNIRQEQADDVIIGRGKLALTAFRSTAIAAVRQPLTSTKLGLVGLWQRPRALVSGNSPLVLVDQPASNETPGTPAFEQLLDRKHFPPAESGSLKWLVDGPGFFPVLDHQIAKARHSIDFQIYIFDNDDIAVRYADSLKQHSARVPVRVLFDDLGSNAAQSSPPKTLGPKGFIPVADMHSYLRQDSTVRVRRTLNPWLVCDHTKLIVFDQRTAILGGMNIGREYFSEWHDLMVAVEGPVVRTLSREFNRAWRKAGPWGDFALFYKPAIFRKPQPAANGIPLRVLRTDPAEGRYEILDATLLAIQGARKRIWIENPYFAHDDIVIAVAAAAHRGVDVRVIIPAKGDSPLMDAGNLATANNLIRAGAKVFQYPKMTHMKVMLCDDWGIIGSANLDTLSLRINRELNLTFSDPSAVRALEKQVFLPDFRKSRTIKLAETQASANGFAEAIADQF